MNRILKAIALSLMLTTAGVTAAPASVPLPAIEHTISSRTLAPLLRQVMPAVVTISVKTYALREAGSTAQNRRDGRRTSDVVLGRLSERAGSGVVFDAGRGFIVTNNHVIARAEDIKVTLTDGRVLTAVLVGADAATDLAVIKVEPDRLTPITATDSDRLEIGDFVLATGNPHNIGQTGVVTAVGAEAGQIVNIGQMVVRLAQPNDKDGVFAIAETAFRQRPAQPPEVIVSLLSNPGITAEGVVREISPVADHTTRTYQVKVTLKDPPEQMRFGGSVVGRLKTSTAPVVVLPGSALFDRSGQAAVWVVDPTGNTVSLRPIVVNRYETDRVIVGEGLMKGDLVVTAGVNRLRENQKVRVAEDTSK